MNKITVTFTECSPTPANGYNIQFKAVGTNDPLIDAGNFTSSPAVFFDDTYPDATCYEGFIRSDCSESGQSGTKLGDQVEWRTPCSESGQSGQGRLINLRFSSLYSEICTSSTEAVYIDPSLSDITTGVIIYNDPALTIIFDVGFSFVTNLGGTIFNYDNPTGTVGSPTGDAC